MLNFLKQLKIFKMIRGVYSELLAANTRLFQVKTLFSKTLVILSEKAQFIWPSLGSRVGDKK